MLQIPKEGKRAAPWRPGAVMFYAGNKSVNTAQEIVQQMLPEFVLKFPSGKFIEMSKEQVGMNATGIQLRDKSRSQG